MYLVKEKDGGLYENLARRINTLFTQISNCNIDNDLCNYLTLSSRRGSTFSEHNFRYLDQCFTNLQEKYDRGQVDFDDKTYENLVQFMNHKYEKQFEGVFKERKYVY